MIIMFTTYEVSMFTHYENMKGEEKCKNWGGLEGYGSPKVILYRFRVIARFFVKSCQF